MAHLLNATRFTSPATAASTFNITIPSTAANSKLVVVAGGGATIQAKLGVGGTNFTKRTNSLSTREVVAQDIVDSSGGTTTIQFTLNGPENIDGMIFEFASGTLGNFISGANEGGSGTASNNQVSTGNITTSGASVLFMMFTSGDTFTDPARKFWGMDPVGKQYANAYINTDASKTKYWSMIGLSDQLAAGTFQGISSHVQGGEQQSVIWAYENLDTGTPTYTNPYANQIIRENSRPGVRYLTWFGADNSPNICGYTDSMSYNIGDTVNFKVDSNNIGFTIDIYRVGYYGYISFGAKQITTITGTPAVQSAPSINSFGGTFTSWSTTATWAIPSTVTPGVYVYNMRRTDNNSLAQGIFVVKSTTPATRDASKMAVILSDFTWQAYNVWGSRSDWGNGYSGYTGRSLYGQAPSVAIGGRAFAVSYDRPFGTVSANTQSYYWESEGALTSFLEGNGYDVHYYSSVDLDKDPTIAGKYGVLFSSGHDEYWTKNKRDAFDNARDGGTNIIILSSNTALWHVRFDPADTNRRTMICYKDSHDTAGYDGTTKYDPTTFTGTWRDARHNPGGVNNTDRRPEPSTTGQWFIGNGTFVERIAVPDTYKSLPIWRNTRIASGATISVRGTNSNVITTAGTALSIDQPSSTQPGDLLVFAITFGNTVNFDGNGFRVVRQTVDTSGQTTALMYGYANVAGTVTFNFLWTGSTQASGVVVAYANAVWEDLDTSIVADHSGGATHTTRTIANDGSNRWAVCVFADSTASSGTATTSWTAGAGLTSRIGANTSAAASGRWTSIALMDTNGAVTQGTHSYSATAQFANSVAAAGIFYISPGKTLFASTVGAEWDYVKQDEPSTPTNLVMLSKQAIPLVSQASNYNGNDYGRGGLFHYGLSMFRAASGALVFNAGTWRYQWGISRIRAGTFDPNASVDVAMQQALINLIRDMGIAPPTLLDTVSNGDATALVDPGSAASASAYGFDVAPPTTYQSIFTVDNVPQNLNPTDNTDYTLGTLFSAARNGKVHGVRWYFPETMPDAPVIGLLFSWTDNSSGVELARLTFKNTQTGWNQALFSAPVDITAGTKYLVAVWTSDHYVSSAGTFTSSGITNGDLTAPQDSSLAHNGKYLPSVGAPAYPTQTFGGNSYFADVLFEGGALQFEGWGQPLA
jgi:hypothetical protein